MVCKYFDFMPEDYVTEILFFRSNKSYPKKTGSQSVQFLHTCHRITSTVTKMVMTTRSNPGRGFTMGRGTKTHHQVFDQHTRAHQQAKYENEKNDSDSTEKSTTMDIHSARTENRYTSLSIRDKRKKKVGRGYNRQNWIRHHQMIVERAVNRTDQNSENKIVQLTEVLRNRQNISDQKNLHEDELILSDVDSKVDSTNETSDKDLMDELNVCMDRLKNLPNERKSSTRKLRSTDTIVPGDSHDSPVLREEDNIKESFNEQKNKQEEPINESVIDGNVDTHMDQNKQTKNKSNIASLNPNGNNEETNMEIEAIEVMDTDRMSKVSIFDQNILVKITMYKEDDTKVIWAIKLCD